jgi:tetratricopeptide (TPR) repeat protein
LTTNTGLRDSGETRFWAVGAWTAAHAVQPKDANTHAILHAFTRDGRMAAVLHSPSKFIQLIDPASGHEFATLQPPDGHWATSLSFSADGSQLAVTGSGAIHVWDLRLIRRQLAEMGLDWNLPDYARPTSHASKPLRVEVLDAAPLVPDKELDAEAYLRRARLYARLERYSEAVTDFKQTGKLAPQFEPKDASDYVLRGLWSTEGKHWERAVTDFTQAIALRPDARSYWSRRGYIHAEMAEWRKADLDYTKVTELPGSTAWEWYYHALLRLRLGDTGGYRRACATTLERFGKSNPNWVIQACLLGPDAMSDWPSVIALAEQPVAKNPDNYDNLNQLGAVLYRAGRWGEAVKRLAEADATIKDAKFARGTVASTWYFLAMAYHQLGHADEAGRWLRKASALLEEAEMGSPEDDLAKQRLTWERQLRRQLLRREAEGLVKKQPGVRNQKRSRNN